MSKLKKIMGLILFLTLGLVLTACGSAADAEDEASTFVIATDTTFAPFVFQENGEMIGIDMDILRAVAQDQGFNYELQVIGFQAAMASLESGMSDGMIAGMSITPERQERFDFSNPYWDASFGVGVLPGTTFNDFEDFAGKQVAAKIGTTGAAFAQEKGEEYGFSVVLFEDSPTMYQSVISGDSIGLIEDYPVLGFEISRGLGLEIAKEYPRETSFGFAVLKGENAELLEMFNAGLANIKANGTFDEIVSRYID